MVVDATMSTPSVNSINLVEVETVEQLSEDSDYPLFENFPSCIVEMEEENTPRDICDDRHDEAGVELEEVDNDYDDAPLPPETIAASYEDVKPEFIQDGDDIPVLSEQIVGSYERRGDEEEKMEDVDEEDDAPIPPGMIAESFEGNDHEEAKREDIEDEYAPPPPGMIAASCDTDTKAKLNEKKIPVAFEDTIGCFINSIQDVYTSNDAGSTILPVIGTESLPNDETLPDTDNQERPSMSNLQLSTTTSEQVDAASIFRSEMGDNMRLPTSVHGHVELAINRNLELMPGSQPDVYPNDQSLPLLEGTLVQNVPEEPVYDAFPLEPIQDNDEHVWSRRFHKYKSILLGLVLLTTAGIIAVVILKIIGNRSEETRLKDDQETTITSTTSTTVAPTDSEINDTSLWKLQAEFFGVAASDSFGNSVALSADAATLVVGANGYTKHYENSGYVKVYYRGDSGGSSWKPLGQTLVGNATSDLFGQSVDITADGQSLAIGASGIWETYDRPGYVSVYYLARDDDLGSIWKQRGQNITGEGKGDMFGNSVSLSGDGKVLAVGALYGNEDSGQVQIYRWEDDGGTSWKPLGQIIHGEDGSNTGYSVSLSMNGSIVAIGSPYGNGNGIYSGYVKVYQLDGETGWVPLGQTLNGDTGSDNSGWSVYITPDGTYLAVGFPGASVEDRKGYVRVYHLDTSGDLGHEWKQFGDTIIGEEIADSFGYSVSLSDDGKILAVGAAFNDGNGNAAGHVRVFWLDNLNLIWNKHGEDIDGEAPDDFAGFNVVLSANGKTVALGSWDHDHNGQGSGNVRVFDSME
ncbi:hypothetical protein ACHAXA_005514 [Cyclostephanos tholiformis]|uniref:Uncharacterized protein n=1 Tax=Cyclostephanos tholiformis TaxID=382380 RepID=A0ABD3R8S7_9STRA